MSALLHRWRRQDWRNVPHSARMLIGCVLMIAVIGALLANLLYLRSRPGVISSDDVFAYECYARAFWRGSQALVDAPLTRYCGDHRWLFWTAPPQAFHTLPREYPAPALALFSLPLLLPIAPYATAYMVFCAVVVGSTTTYLITRGLLRCAAAFVMYMLIGGWATLLARYDLVPGVLVLAALVLAQKSRYMAAYMLLAAAALLKVYPGFVALVLATHHWRAIGRPPLRAAVLFVSVLLVGSLPGAVLNWQGFIGPISYNGPRPPQIESVIGSLLWLSGKVGGHIQVRLTYHSVNVLGDLAGAASWLATTLFLGGVVLVCRRAWHGQDSLERSFVLMLLVMLCTSKLLSPQYLLWLFPVAAYVEGLRVRWFVLAVLTLAIFPFGYQVDHSLVLLPRHPFFMGGILARNFLLVAIALGYLISPSGASRMERTAPTQPGTPQMSASTRIS